MEIQGSLERATWSNRIAIIRTRYPTICDKLPCGLCTHMPNHRNGGRYHTLCWDLEHGRHETQKRARSGNPADVLLDMAPVERMEFDLLEPKWVVLRVLNWKCTF